jgi:acetylornithine deacetylase/succinyl-diaminopimelate desuccinylase-like protein
MRTILALLLAGLSVPALAADNPVMQPTKLSPPWQAKTRAFFKDVIETPSVVGRGQVPKVAQLVAAQLQAAGFPASSMQIMPYEGLDGDKTAAFLFRWKAERATKKPMLIIGHMDVVEAKREDWKEDPFTLIEKDGYFYGRGTMDMKHGIVATTLSLAKLKQEGFRPDRDIIVFFTGDEETKMNGALFASTNWRNLIDAEFALNADGGGAAYDRTGRPLGQSMTAAEKVYQTYFWTVRNPGGHSSRPRPDNAIYDLADALKKLQGYSFKPELNPTTRAYLTERQKDEKGPLGDAMRRWLANENDREAADAIEADSLEVGITRTRCVATMLKGGHADNALPQSATATVNCRMMPGTQPTSVQAELQQLVGPKVEIVPDPSFIGQPTPVLPLRDDVAAAIKKAVLQFYGPEMRVIPTMSTGTSDASFFRSINMPVFGADGGFGIAPDDERAHGLNERIPVRAVYDDVLFWQTLVKELAGR